MPTEPDADTLAEIRDRIIVEQSLKRTILSSVAGTLLGFFLWALVFLSTILAPVLVGMSAALLVRYVGRVFTIQHRIVVGLIVFVFLMVVGRLLFWPDHWRWVGVIFLTLPNTLIAIGFSRRPLTPKEEKAIYRYRVGVDGRQVG